MWWCMNHVSCKAAAIADFIEVIDKLNVCCPILSVQIQAVIKGSREEVEKLLRENADPDQSDYVSKKNINIIILYYQGMHICSSTGPL